MDGVERRWPQRNISTAPQGNPKSNKPTEREKYNARCATTEPYRSRAERVSSRDRVRDKVLDPASNQDRPQRHATAPISRLTPLRDHQLEIPFLLRDSSTMPSPAVPRGSLETPTLVMKRKSADGMERSENEAKRTCLSYGKVIKITVFERGKGNGIPAWRKSFYIDRKLLYHHSGLLKKRVEVENTSGLQITDIDHGDFDCYLFWMYEKNLAPGFIHNGEGTLANGPEHTASEDGEKLIIVLQYCKTGAAVLRLCKLLRMNAVHLNDEGFKAKVLDRLEDCTRGILGERIHLSLCDGQQLWRMSTHKFGEVWALPKPTASFVRAKIAEWMAPGLSREIVEDQSEPMDLELLNALRKLLPFVSIKICISSGENEKTISVNRKIALRRSPVIAERIATTGEVSLKKCHKEISQDISGNIRVAGDHEAAILERWAQTLTEKGDELNKLHERYPSMAIDRIGACEFKTILCKMWILAESLGDLHIQRVMLAALMKYSGGNECHPESLTWQTVNLIAEKLSPDSGLRRWVVDLIAAEIDVAGLRSLGSKIDPRILVDLLEKEKRGVESVHRRPQPADIGKYWTMG